MAPCPFLQNLRILQLKEDLSEPVCPKMLCRARSTAWSLAERWSPSWVSKGCKGFCLSRNFLASFQAALPSLVQQIISSLMGIYLSLMKVASCLSMRLIKQLGSCLATLMYLIISAQSHILLEFSLQKIYKILDLQNTIWLKQSSSRFNNNSIATEKTYQLLVWSFILKQDLQLQYRCQVMLQSQAVPPEKSINQKKIEEDIRKQEQFAQKIRQNDEIKILLRKITILKEGVFAERDRKKHLQSEMEKARKKIEKYEDENNRKEKKYEELTAEIKKLKDEIIEERNKKHKIHEKIVQKQRQIQLKNPEQQNKNKHLGLFGFRSMFSHP